MSSGCSRSRSGSSARRCRTADGRGLSRGGRRGGAGCDLAQDGVADRADGRDGLAVAELPRARPAGRLGVGTHGGPRRFLAHSLEQVLEGLLAQHPGAPGCQLQLAAPALHGPRLLQGALHLLESAQVVGRGITQFASQRLLVDVVERGPGVVTTQLCLQVLQLPEAFDLVDRRRQRTGAVGERVPLVGRTAERRPPLRRLRRPTAGSVRGRAARPPTASSRTAGPGRRAVGAAAPSVAGAARAAAMRAGATSRPCAPPTGPAARPTCRAGRGRTRPTCPGRRRGQAPRRGRAGPPTR